MASFDNFPYMLVQEGLVTVASSTDSFSDSATITPQSGSVGAIVTVAVVGAGSATITMQTSRAEASESNANSWLDLDTYQTNFDLTTLNNAVRLRAADYVLDRVRIKISGDSTAAASLRVAILSDREVL